jgi:hypothetical protein
MPIQLPNFKKLSPSELLQRIQRIGGDGWVTPEDYKRFSKQSVAILEYLLISKGTSVTVDRLSTISGAKRVASRIDELRDEWEIETVKYPATKMASYVLQGRRWEARKKKAHCSTCHCFQNTKTVPEGQIGLGI